MAFPSYQHEIVVVAENPATKNLPNRKWIVVSTILLCFTALVSIAYNNNKSQGLLLLQATSSSVGQGLLQQGAVQKDSNFYSTETSRTTRRKIREALQELHGRIDGDVYFPSDGQDFETAARVWRVGAAALHHPPAAIIEVATEQDVLTALAVLVQLQQQSHYNFTFRIRSGGHNKAGYSTTDESGAVLSLTRLNTIHWQKNDGEDESHSTTGTRSVRFGPAVTVNQFVQQVMIPTGYAGVIGFCGSVAEGGFVLGGGFGMQSRLYGLGLDSVTSLRVALADGRLLTASAQNNSDLFWALRGAGGGSFGVVTEIVYQVHRASNRFHFVSLKLPTTDMADFLFRLGEMEPNAPGNFLAMHDQIDTVNLLWSGRDAIDIEVGETYLNDLVDSIGSASIRNATQRGSLNWSSMYDGDIQKTWGGSVYAAACWAGFLLPENNTAEVWHDILRHIEIGLFESPHLLPDIELWGGAISKKAANATAFPYRSAIYNVGVLLTIPPDELHADVVYEREYRSVNQWWPKVAQYLSGSYVNYPSVSLLDNSDKFHYSRVFWGKNLDRLVEIKRQYDPNDVFRFPMSVPVNL